VGGLWQNQKRRTVFGRRGNLKKATAHKPDWKEIPMSSPKQITINDFSIHTLKTVLIVIAVENVSHR
jgi:hypothetical protein